jgi:methylmalonyl-CoA/ethylmalonyl-CoA epimerase
MRFDHVNIATPDAEALAATFSALFGLEVERRVTVEDQGVKVIKLDAGSARIELTEPTGPETPVGRFLAKNRPGLHHIALAVPDIRAAMADVQRKGAILINDEPSIGAEGYPVAFVHPKSCGGVLVELVEKKQQ